jgi:hypothetical protein
VRRNVEVFREPCKAVEIHGDSAEDCVFHADPLKGAEHRAKAIELHVRSVAQQRLQSPRSPSRLAPTIWLIGNGVNRRPQESVERKTK